MHQGTQGKTSQNQTHGARLLYSKHRWTHLAEHFRDQHHIRAVQRVVDTGLEVGLVGDQILWQQPQAESIFKPLESIEGLENSCEVRISHRKVPTLLLVKE